VNIKKQSLEGLLQSPCGETLLGKNRAQSNYPKKTFVSLNAPHQPIVAIMMSPVVMAGGKILRNFQNQFLLRACPWPSSQPFDHVTRTFSILRSRGCRPIVDPAGVVTASSAARDDRQWSRYAKMRAGKTHSSSALPAMWKFPRQPTYTPPFRPADSRMI